MSEYDNSFSESGQSLAHQWLNCYLTTPQKASSIRENADSAEGSEQLRRRALRLFNSTLRNLLLYDSILNKFVERKPETKLRACLLLCLSEIDLAKCINAPPIIDSWVNFAKKTSGRNQAGFANAVSRKAFGAIRSIRNDPQSTSLSNLFSHPEWLIDHWTKQFGERTTKDLLQWNQRQPKIYCSSNQKPSEANRLQPSRWPRFFELPKGLGSALSASLKDGSTTIRDPATRLAEAMVLSNSPKTVLDLCSSPGGKARAILSNPKRPKSLVAADLEPRLDRLKESLQPWVDCTSIEPLDLSNPHTFPSGWANRFPAVLLDAPCTNTGVIRRKPDVKYRLSSDDLKKMPLLQQNFLREASSFVALGGNLIYSTCSIEPAENRWVVDQFLRSPDGSDFRLTGAIQTIPTVTGHDGAGVYRLLRVKGR
ncbi:MAG: transcription antitermination factor NusB [Verrucomicrobiota bacterium]